MRMLRDARSDFDLRNIPGACEGGVPLRVCVRLRSYPREVSGSRDPASQRARANPTATTGHAGSSTPARACQMAVAVGASKPQSLLERYGVEIRAASSGGEACQFIRILARISDMMSGFRELEKEELALVMFFCGGQDARVFVIRVGIALRMLRLRVVRASRSRAVACAGFGGLRLRRQLVDRQRWKTRFVVLVLSHCLIAIRVRGAR